MLTLASLFQGNGSNASVVIDADGFITVGPNGRPRPDNDKRGPHKRKPMNIGASDRLTSRAATRMVKASVFTTRHEPDMTVEKVIEDLKTDERLKDLNIKAEKLVAKHNSYSSFHVTCVCTEDQSKIFYEPEVWPQGVAFRQWREKRNQNLTVSSQSGDGFTYNNRDRR